MKGFATSDWLIFISYLMVVIGLGLAFTRNSAKSYDDYFLGGRNMRWWVVGLSLFATIFSANSFVGIPAIAAFEDYHLFLAMLLVPLIIAPLTAIVFVPFYRRLNISSFYTYLEMRFGRSVQRLASFAFLLFTVGWLGNMLVATGRMLHVVLATSDSQVYLVIIVAGTITTLYATFGGVRAVIWTDALQSIILTAGAIGILWIAYVSLDGGWSAFYDTASEHGRLEMFRTDGGFFEPNVFSACAFAFSVYLGGHIASYTSFQRYVSVATTREAQKAVWLQAFLTICISAVFFAIGTILFVFFQQADPETYGALGTTGDGRDILLPRYLMDYIQYPGVRGLFIAALVAATMSSYDGALNSMAATTISDWGHEGEFVRLKRALSLGFGLLGVAFGCFIHTMRLPVVETLMSIAGACVGSVLAVLLLGIFVSRANKLAALCTFVGGPIGFGIAKIIGVQPWWDGAFVCLTGLISGIIVILITVPSKEDRSLTIWSMLISVREDPQDFSENI